MAGSDQAVGTPTDSKRGRPVFGLPPVVAPDGALWRRMEPRGLQIGGAAPAFPTACSRARLA